MTLWQSVWSHIIGTTNACFFRSFSPLFRLEEATSLSMIYRWNKRRVWNQFLFGTLPTKVFNPAIHHKYGPSRGQDYVVRILNPPRHVRVHKAGSKKLWSENVRTKEFKYLP